MWSLLSCQRSLKAEIFRDFAMFLNLLKRKYPCGSFESAEKKISLRETSSPSATFSVKSFAHMKFKMLRWLIYKLLQKPVRLSKFLIFFLRNLTFHQSGFLFNNPPNAQKMHSKMIHTKCRSNAAVCLHCKHIIKSVYLRCVFVC